MALKAETGGSVNGENADWMTKAREFWSRRYGHPVSEAEVEEIQRNLKGFFDLLCKNENIPVENRVDSTPSNNVESERKCL